MRMANKHITWILWSLLALALSLVTAPLWAQVQSNDDNSGGSNSLHIGSGDALGIGFGSQSFDVDINQCMGSTARAWAFGLYGAQGLKPNHWCQAESLYRMEKYQAAALTWCYKTGLGELYGDVDVCMAEMSQPPALPLPLEPSVFDKTHLEEEERHEDELEQMQMYQVKMVERMEELESRPTVVQYGITDEQKAAIKEVMEQ